MSVSCDRHWFASMSSASSASRVSSSQAGRGDRFGQLFGAQLQRLRGEALFGQAFAQAGQALLRQMPLLFQLAEFEVAIFQRAARLDQLLVDQQALVEIGLSFGFEFGDRIGAGGELFGDLVAARFDLAQLAVHAAQRLLQRAQRGTLRFQRQRQRMRLLGGFARVHARFFARFEQRAALVFQFAALVFQVAHQADRFVQPRACLAGLALQFVDLGEPGRPARR